MRWYPVFDEECVLVKLPSLILALCVGAGGPATAAAQLVDATDPERLGTIIRDLGYRARIDMDGVGDPMIASSVGGTDFNIYFFGCTQRAGCKSLLFKVGYDLASGTTLEVVNAWNETSLFGRAYRDEDGDPWLEMSVNMDGGVSLFNFQDTFDWWEVVLEKFEDHIEF